MRIKLIIAILISIIVTKVQGQDFFVLLNDSNAAKSQCYLMVCSDQLTTGLVKMSDFKFDSVAVNTSKIIPLKTTGLNWNLLFFKFVVKTHGAENLSYIFCYNQEYREYYKVESFRNNDFYNLFEYLQRQRMKLTEDNFKREKVYVEDVDMLCLLSLYKKKVKDKNKSVSEADRQRFKCLRYHYQPVTVY